jgi:heme/copper-type cytochrome/quinol oxidase subunit 3
MTPRFVHDVSDLPNHAFGRDSILWWGTLGFVAIEATAFVLAAAAYFYLMREVPTWPPGSIAPPGLLYGTALTAVMLLSLAPNHWTKQVAEQHRRRAALVGMAVLLAIGIALLVLRGYEFTVLNVRWDTNAYGSIIWALLGLHTVHLATDVVDTAVLLAVAIKEREVEPRRFTDIAENSDYWYFVVFAWLPLYGLIYLMPRLD